MPWIVKLDKDDFVGKWSLEHVHERGFREQLVGFETESGVVPLEGGQIVLDGKPAGRVTSARWSDHLGRAIGMAWVPPDLAEEDAELTIKVERLRREGERAPAAVLRPRRGEAPLVTQLDFLSPDLAAADARLALAARAGARARAGRDAGSPRTGVLEVRGELDGLDAGEAEVVRLTPGARPRAVPLRARRDACGRRSARADAIAHRRHRRAARRSRRGVPRWCGCAGSALVLCPATRPLLALGARRSTSISPARRASHRGEPLMRG